MSDYAYRGMPLTTGPFGYFATYTAGLMPRVYIKGTKPRVVAEVACPAFKTQKTLGGRAIVADSFGRGNEYYKHIEYYDNYRELLGHGWYAHREGYNVLYGDWHAKWYGDPKERFIWWPSFPSSFSTSRTQMFSGASTEASGLYWFDPIDGDPDSVYEGKFDCTGATAWHILDAISGVDVGVDGH